MKRRNLILSGLGLTGALDGWLGCYACRALVWAAQAICLLTEGRSGP